jgi:formylglycine-generating enzyme
MPANKGNATVTPPVGENPVAERKPAVPGRPAARLLPPGFKAIDEAGVNEAGWPLVIVGERDGAKMVLVPGATFIMGHDGGAPEDGPAHAVRLSTYYIDQHEVTNRQFRTFLEDTQYLGQPAGRWLVDEKLRALPDNAPAVFVNYHDAEAYAIWALKRLPTEAQWELAARSVDGRRHPWGDDPVRWVRERKFRQIDPVMSFPEDSSPFGVFDMAGNALEWARDWYDPRYFHRLRDKTTDDPPGPPSKQKGIQRSVRGGSKDWLVFDRQGVDSDHRAAYLSFRCTLAVEGGEASANIVPHSEKPDSPKPGSTPPAGQAGGGAVPF